MHVPLQTIFNLSKFNISQYKLGYDKEKILNSQWLKVTKIYCIVLLPQPSFQESCLPCDCSVIQSTLMLQHHFLISRLQGLSPQGKRDQSCMTAGKCFCLQINHDTYLLSLATSSFKDSRKFNLCTCPESKWDCKHWETLVLSTIVYLLLLSYINHMHKFQLRHS